MGLLKAGNPMPWAKTLAYSKYIRQAGITQFLNTYLRCKDIQGDRLFYGDEIEYALLRIDTVMRKARLSLRGIPVMERLRKEEQRSQPERGCAWHQEYGSWMLEGTPSTPYGGYTSSLLEMEHNMRLRRARIVSVLEPDEIVPTLTSFPHMGVGDFVDPPSQPNGPVALSDYVPDSCINPHPRFATLTQNIRTRRGSKVDIRVPAYKAEGVAADDTIHMDAMAFGMGQCCLQVTFQGSDMAESQYLYDQLGTLAPVLMALTAATPIFRGRLSDIDVRWSTVAGAVDDRTAQERGEPDAPPREPDPQMVGGGITRMSKSRYESISCYISEHSPDAFNDVPCEVDEEVQARLVSEGINKPVSRHLAHLFTRDPIAAFDNVEEVEDSSMDHFENINSTNWQSVRWKPPPPPAPGSPHIGWRTEFRTMEVQMTDFENAAFSAFIVLLTRCLLVFNLDILVPLSAVDENMRRAHARDAVNTQKFWFRRSVLPEDERRDDCEEMTMQEIMYGKGRDFPGLLPLCYAYLEHIGCDSASYLRVQEYLNFIGRRATGELQTPATWIRNYVQSHKEYKHDGIVPDGVCFDLVRSCDEIGRGMKRAKELHGPIIIHPLMQEGVYHTELGSGRRFEALQMLLRKLRDRASAVDGPGSLPTAPMRHWQDH